MEFKPDYETKLIEFENMDCYGGKIHKYKDYRHETELLKTGIQVAEEWLDKRECIIEGISSEPYEVSGYGRDRIVILVLKEKIYEDHEDY